MARAKDIGAFERWQAALNSTTHRMRKESHGHQTLTERPRTVSEAAEELGLSVHTIRAWIASRRLGHLRLGRAIRIPAAEIRRVLEESAVPAMDKEED